MKTWVQKLIQQFDIDWSKSHLKPEDMKSVDISDEKATLLYILDVYNKNLFEIEKQPIRKVREILDQFTQSLVKSKGPEEEKLLFRIRQFFSAYRIDEYSYIQTTFEDFKSIIWDFADQLGEDAQKEQKMEENLNSHLMQLREAVESNSIEDLRHKSREFIDLYVEMQNLRDKNRSQQLDQIQTHLKKTQKKLTEANQNLMVDHLTQAYNRRSFDEQIKKQIKLYEFSKTPTCLLALDIDFFKKINDAYGHDIGDFVLIESVKILKEVFSRKEDFIARTGGEEFMVILPEMNEQLAIQKAEELLQRVRKEVLVHGGFDIRFTFSIGISPLTESDKASEWIKKADTALYESKRTGRNRWTLFDEKMKKAV